MSPLVCWRCGASLKMIALPIARLAQCRQCGAELHVCRQCKFYNPQLNDKCDHDMAEPAREVDVANFCDYFLPQHGTHGEPTSERADTALARLKSLFGDETSGQTTPASQEMNEPAESKPVSDRDRFEALFRKD